MTAARGTLDMKAQEKVSPWGNGWFCRKQKPLSGTWGYSSFVFRQHLLRSISKLQYDLWLQSWHQEPPSNATEYKEVATIHCEGNKENSPLNPWSLIMFPPYYWNPAILLLLTPHCWGVNTTTETCFLLILRQAPFNLFACIMTLNPSMYSLDVCTGFVTRSW